MSYVMQAILGNPKAPEHGVATVSFPLSEAEYDHSIAAILEPMGIGSAVSRDCMVEEIDSFYEVLQCLRGQMVNVDELDYLAKRLDSFDAYEGLQFQTVCSAFRVTDIQTLINLTFCCQRVTVISDFSKLEEVGKAHYLATHRGSVPTEELGKISGKAIAEKLIRSRTGRPTTYGLFFHNEMSIEKLYQGKGFPSYLWDQRQAELELAKPDGTTAVIFLPFTKLELERFLRREDIPDIRACKRTLLLLQSKERTFVLEGGKAELDEWNKLCQELNAMPQTQQQKFSAAVEVTGAEDLNQLQLLATSLEDFDLIPGIKDAKSYGRYMIQESGKYDYDESLDCYYNYEALGEFLMTHETGKFTKQGYLKCEEGSAFLDFFVQTDSEAQNQVEEMAESRMSKDTFWELIAGAKKASGQDMDGYLQSLTKCLSEMNPQCVQDFHNIMHGYQDLAYQYGLWTAASLMCDGGCSDDGFIDFRAWLIAQGREVYLAALADPDSMALVDRYEGCQFEELSYVGHRVLKEMTGQDAYGCMDDAIYDALLEDLRSDISYGAGINYPYEWNELPSYFPRLCAKYLKPGDIELHESMGHTMWFHDNDDIQKAREGGPPQRTLPQFEMEMGGM